MKKNLIGLTQLELQEELRKMDEKIFHTKQIWSWIYYFGIQSFDKMHNLSKLLRKKLEKHYTLERPKIIKDLLSKDGTRKWMLQFSDGKEIEMVYIPEEDRGTLCISSQVGCAMGCKFCNTGAQGFCRNMTVEEIIQQLMIARDSLDEWQNLSKNIGGGRKITNLVIMGMGEPLNNYENIVKAIKIINDKDGIAFSKRRITLSTCGLVSEIRKLAQDLKVNLAISLHASTDEIRKK
jgi:23S rRNA (adenine2503-C2)-methyltransferase